MDFKTFGKFTYRAEEHPESQTSWARNDDSPWNQAARATLNRILEWPQRGSISRQIVDKLDTSCTVNLTMRMHGGYDADPDSNNANALEVMFHQAAGLRADVNHMVKGQSGVGNIMRATVTQELINTVFSSNYIERVGLNLTETTKICRRIFDGEEVDATDISEEAEGYEKQLKAIIGETIPVLDSKSMLIRSRREVIQHAKALKFLLHRFSIRNQPLSEEMVKATHRILTSEIDNYHRDGTYTPWRSYSGAYRSIPVAAGNTNFAVPRHVPKLMREMVEDFNRETAKAEMEGVVDPFFMAAKYSDMFVQIHPFEDGNGRVSRLILNAVLVKYAGITIAIGGDEMSRKQYLDIMRRSGEEMRGGDELAGLVLEKSVEILEAYLRGQRENAPVETYESSGKEKDNVR